MWAGGIQTTADHVYADIITLKAAIVVTLSYIIIIIPFFNFVRFLQFV